MARRDEKRKIIGIAECTEPLDLRLRTILETAEKIFSSSGFKKTTMEGIASASNVSKPTLYTYFANKYELFFATLVFCLGRFFKIFKKKTRTARNARDKLIAYLESVELLLRHLTLYRDMYLENRTLAQKWQSSSWSRDTYLRGVEFVEKILKQGVEEGSFRAMNTKLVAHVLCISTLVFLYDLQTLGGREFKFGGELAPSLGELILQGIMK